MEKAKFRKNIHFTNEEEIFVAKMISEGADYNKVAQWYLHREKVRPLYNIDKHRYF